MVLKISLRGSALLRDPLLNKETAFSHHEKGIFNLYGLLPENTETIEQQLERCNNAYSAKNSYLEKHIYLRALQDRNEILFYRFIITNLTEMMPIIYTPVVGEACQNFDKIYRSPRGLFISYPEREQMDSILQAVKSHRRVKVIVFTDGERVLGLGDQGVGGLGIPIGKLSLYTVCGGINPANTLPIILDVGTNNQEKLNDPEYLGWRHPRITGKKYADFVDHFVQSVKKHFPHVLLQFEDFAQQNAYPLLERYRDQLCTFNDDIQGTAAVALAAIIAATNVTNSKLKDQKIAVFGAGSAGCGISEQIIKAMTHQGLSPEDARAQFYLIDKNGLLDDSMQDLLDFQRPFARTKNSLDHWTCEQPGKISLLDVVNNAQPTILLGVSAQPNQFTETIVKSMNKYCERPIIFPLSNPTSKAEATPCDLLTWTSGNALVATGSPFESVVIGTQKLKIDQCNNSYIFPGIGLAVVAGHARRVTDGMMMAAAIALSELAPSLTKDVYGLLPDLSNIRNVSQHIASAVILQGILEGHIDPIDKASIKQAIKKTMWFPEYEKFDI